MTNIAPDVVEPLEPRLWFERFRAIGAKSLALDGEPPERLLRQVFHLSVLTPIPLRHLLETQMSEETFEAFAECGAYDSAALGLIGKGMSYMIRRNSGESAFELKLSLGDTLPTATAAAEYLAKAILIAYCECMNSLREHGVFEALLKQRRQTAQSGSRPKSSMH